MARIEGELVLDASPSRLMTRAFVLLCAATALGYAHLALLTPILPLFIKDHGGTASLVGIVTAAFSVTSFGLRPFIGRAVDNWSARRVMLVGTLALGLSSFGYLFYHAVFLLIMRAVHGTAWAAYNTGSKVLVSATAPAERRGEASGYFSMSQSVASALVPATAAFAPSVMALAIDRAPPERLGAAMATFSMAFQLAQGAGGLLGGILIDTVGYQAMYLTMALAPLAAQVIVLKSGGARDHN